MATALDEFPKIARAPRKPVESKYPWAKWSDGQVWHLVDGEDFTCTPISLRGLAAIYAKREGLKVKSRLPGDGSIYIQFLDVTSEAE